MKRIRFNKLHFHTRLILVMSVTVVIMFGCISSFYIVKIRNQLRKQVLQEIEVTTNQLQTELNTKIRNISSITDMLYTNSDLNRRLTMEYKKPLEYWEFYNYLTQYSSEIMMTDRNITLITFFTANPTLLPDKKNVRLYQEIKESSVYQDIVKKGGSCSFYMMRDVFSKNYFKYNSVSDPRNICLFRYLKYNSSYYIMAVEISKDMFAGSFKNERNKEMYVLDGSDNILMHYKNGKNVWSEKDELSQLNNQQGKVNSTCILNNQWKIIVSTDTKTMFLTINRTIYEMLYAGVLIILGALFITILIIRKMSSRIMELNQMIREVHQSYDDMDFVKEEMDQDEIGIVILSFKRLMERVQYLMKEVYEKEIKTQSIELELLHSQIKPHFLYNTLSSISSLARKYHDRQLLEMISSLSDLYRISLNRGKNLITLELEIQITRCYIYIMENRFKDFIHISMDIEPDTLEGIIPKVIFQPFVENAINHAMKPEQILNIHISSKREGDNLILMVKDDGVGMDLEKQESIFHDMEGRTGFGIRNVHQRIKITYGDEYGVKMVSTEGAGTTVMIRMPYCQSGYGNN
ncbi:histidine kinase [Anaerocolumna sp. AGMB13025]|uniref:sensor histidine kinase n=1 Tax=Anaerocolumna sp. AGMB13025 TaxID=3039116 RepID=UPI00241EC1B1|nr:histidine kinase [Anaerocolumna sp. AGMB13025]WFR57923.1 histidine kinase [Anaerocolumna sp. AGMB13025]